MQKAFLSVISSLLIVLIGVTPEAQAGKSYSSGSSSGSSSKPAGSSYSSSKPASSYTPSRPASSSGSSSNSYSKPAGSSYSTGKPAASSGNTGSGKSYSSGSSSGSSSYTPPANNSSGSSSRKPTGSSFNSGLSQSGASSESKSKYEAANPPPKRYEASVAPKSTYKPSGSTVEKPIPANSPEVTSVRKYVTHERYVTYDNRASVFYGGYYSQPIYYHDSFSPFLMGWMFSEAMNSHQRAVWAYNHSLDLERDNARYAEMLRRDARLQAEIDALKAQNAPRDASYVPPQMADNPDIMYDKPFIDGAYNPVEVDDDSPGVGHAVGRFFTWVFFIIVGLVILCMFVYYFFMKEY